MKERGREEGRKGPADRLELWLQEFMIVIPAVWPRSHGYPKFEDSLSYRIADEQTNMKQQNVLKYLVTLRSSSYA